MRHVFRPVMLLVPIFAGAAVGCGSATSGDQIAAIPSRVGPHGGLALALPDKAGFVEVVAEFPKSRSKSVKPVIAAYFLKSDLSAPLSPGPSGVTVTAGTPGQEPTTVPLTSAPAVKDRAGLGSARFASEPIDIDPDSTSGELSATVAGQSFTASFHIGR